MECPLCGKQLRTIQTDKGSNILVDKKPATAWICESLYPKPIFKSMNIYVGHNNTCKGKSGKRISKNKIINTANLKGE